ncbi:MAG: hypothetical protein JW814_07295 [Candidatus Krumholzibacteriota bacterium]|nr:hypothetical protein [Candidatus Krumholzibacteriota bacterium]
MLFFRILLIFGLAYYLIKIFGRSFNPGRRSGKPRTGTGGDRRDEDYSELTNQKIEDADYEEIE